MQLILNNPYRTVGLLVGATAREQERQVKRLKQFIDAEQDPQDDFGFQAFGDLNRTMDNVNEATSKLNLDSDKISFALFWFYKGNPITDEPAFDAIKAADLDQAINIWSKLTSNGEVTQRNASAYSNLGTLYLSGILEGSNSKVAILEHGILLKMKFLDSDFINDFKVLATDETYKTSKKELQLLFLQQLQSEVEKSDGITQNKLLDILAKNKFEAKEEFLKGTVHKLIEIIENKIEVTKFNRKANKPNAVNFGIALCEQTSENLKQINSIIETSDLLYSSIADKVANEILQCSIDYFNYYQKNESDINYLYLALNLAKTAESIAIGSLTSERIKDNIVSLEKIKSSSLCFFCNRNKANDNSSHKITLYKETYRSPWYVPSKVVNYQTLEVATPRCKECKQIHDSIPSWLILYSAILFAIIGLILGLTVWGYWLGLLIGGGLFGLIIGTVYVSMVQSIKTSKAQIKVQMDYSEYEPIKNLLNNGWSITIPQA